MQHATIRSALMLLAVGCAGTQAFEPTEHMTARSPGGFAAAEYDLWSPSGNVGEAKVWSRGAYEAEVSGVPATVIEVSFEVDNVASSPMTLTELRLESANLRGAAVHDLAPYRIEGSRVIPPGEQSSLRAYFAVSPPVDPEDVRDFRVRWQLRNEDELVYSQLTPFVQQPPEHSDSPYYGDPFQRGPWGGRYFPPQLGI